MPTLYTIAKRDGRVSYSALRRKAIRLGLPTRGEVSAEDLALLLDADNDTVRGLVDVAPEGYIDSKQAAHDIGIHRSTLNLWINEGLIGAVVVGRTTYVSAEDAAEAKRIRMPAPQAGWVAIRDDKMRRWLKHRSHPVELFWPEGATHASAYTTAEAAQAYEVSTGPSFYPKGNQRKLWMRDALELRARHRAGVVEHFLVSAFGVSPTTAHMIGKGETYQDSVIIEEQFVRKVFNKLPATTAQLANATNRHKADVSRALIILAERRLVTFDAEGTEKWYAANPNRKKINHTKELYDAYRDNHRPSLYHEAAD